LNRIAASQRIEFAGLCRYILSFRRCRAACAGKMISGFFTGFPRQFFEE
jgi:hypothetical protein